MRLVAVCAVVLPGLPCRVHLLAGSCATPTTQRRERYNSVQVTFRNHFMVLRKREDGLISNHHSIVTQPRRAHEEQHNPVCPRQKTRFVSARARWHGGGLHLAK